MAKEGRSQLGTLLFLTDVSCWFKEITYLKSQGLGLGGLNAFFIHEGLIPIGFFFFLLSVSAPPHQLSLTPASASFQLALGGPSPHPGFSVHPDWAAHFLIASGFVFPREIE